MSTYDWANNPDILVADCGDDVTKCREKSIDEERCITDLPI